MANACTFNSFLSGWSFRIFFSEDTVVWSKRDNQIWYDDKPQNRRLGYEPIIYQLNNKNLKIAVLISGITGSSGEMTAMSFKNIPNVRFFGTGTFGFTMGNKSIRIDDGAYLMLTTSLAADANKIVYKNVIEPDTKTNCETIIGELKKWFSEK